MYTTDTLVGSGCLLHTMRIKIEMKGKSPCSHHCVREFLLLYAQLEILCKILIAQIPRTALKGEPYLCPRLCMIAELYLFSLFLSLFTCIPQLLSLISSSYLLYSKFISIPLHVSMQKPPRFETDTLRIKGAQDGNDSTRF